MGAGRLGEFLVAEGLSQADLARGLAVARAEKTRLGSALVLLGLRTSDEVATALARLKGVPAARDKHLAAIAPGTRALLPVEMARRLCAVPVGLLRGAKPALVVAMRDPDDAAAIAELEFATGHPIRPAVACEARLREVIEHMGDDPSSEGGPPPPIDELTPPPRGLAPATPATPPPPAPPATIDLTPITLDVPARKLPRAVMPLVPPPRRTREPTPPVTLAKAAPVGESLLDEPPRREGLPRWLVTLALVGAAVGIAVLAWDFLHDDAPAPGTPIGGEFHCKRLDLTLTMPGAGWIEREDLPAAPSMPNGGRVRTDLFSRGDRTAPGNVLFVARITKDGVFAGITRDQFSAAVDAMRSVATSTLGDPAFALHIGSCTQDTMAGKPLAVCSGTGDVLGTSYDLRFLFWIASDDDAIELIYNDRTDARAAGDVARSIKLD
jgi:hypothetical protein